MKSGKLTRFFVVAGCDAPGSGGEYYRELTQKLPADSIIVTSSCGKFRFNDIDFGTVPGTELPRYLDLGQCNDSIEAVNIAAGLAGLFECEIGELPLTIVLSWMEQKAVAVLMSLLHLGLQGIYLGPKPPAWITPNVFAVLQDAFDLRLTAEDPKADIDVMMA